MKLMALSLKSDRLKRYKDIVALLVKYGRSDLVNQSDITPAEGLSREQIATADEKASELASDLEALVRLLSNWANFFRRAAISCPSRTSKRWSVCRIRLNLFRMKRSSASFRLNWAAASQNSFLNSGLNHSRRRRCPRCIAPPCAMVAP